MKTTKWANFNFNSDGWSENHENHNEAFDQLVRDFRSDIRSIIKGTPWKIVELKGNWFEISGFLFNQETNKYLWFRVSDVRFWPDWINDILIRTAKSDHDYTGGQNHFTSLANFAKTLDNSANWL